MIVYKCDCCETEIPFIKEQDIFGIEREMLDKGFLKCKECDLTSFNLYSDVLLCKSCAEKLSAQIDYELLKLKSNIYKRRVK